MEYIVVLFGLSLIGNLILGYRFYKKHHVLTVDAQRLLADVMAGGVTVNIKVLDTSNLFYRSPKG